MICSREIAEQLNLKLAVYISQLIQRGTFLSECIHVFNIPLRDRLRVEYINCVNMSTLVRNELADSSQYNHG